MSNLDPPWDQYLAIQTKLKKSTSVDDTSWGREAALNRILAGDALTSAEIERTERNGRRSVRYRTALLRQHLPREENSVDAEPALQARSHLRLVVARVTEEERSLLAQIGEGSSYAEIAAATHVGQGALRVRMKRLRLRLLTLAA